MFLLRSPKPIVCCNYEREKNINLSLLRVRRTEYSFSQCARRRNLHLKISAIRFPRTWTGCIEVLLRGTETPAANLSSFFKYRHLCEDIYSDHDYLKHCRILSFRKEPIVAQSQLRKWCVKARRVEVCKVILHTRFYIPSKLIVWFPFCCHFHIITWDFLFKNRIKPIYINKC